jgi:hypothetical protein
VEEEERRVLKALTLEGLGRCESTSEVGVRFWPQCTRPSLLVGSGVQCSSARKLRFSIAFVASVVNTVADTDFFFAGVDCVLPG